MKSLFSRKRNTRAARTTRARHLAIEPLESRELLAGGAIATSAASVNDQIAALLAQLQALQASGGGSAPAITMPSPKVNIGISGSPKTILPGSPKVALMDMYISSTRPFAQPTDMTFVSTSEIVNMAGNWQLRADRDGKASTGVNGCEAVEAWGQANYETGAVTFQFYKKDWIMTKAMHYVLTADFGNWLGQGDSLYLDLAWANFKDPSGKVVPDANISITGVAPTHRVLSATLNLQESRMLPSQTIFAGQQGVDFLDIDVWTNHAQPTGISVISTSGNLSLIEKPVMLVDTNYDGIPEKTFAGGIRNGTLLFKFDAIDLQGFASGKFSVVGNVAANTAGQHFQLGLANAGFSGLDSNTGLSLTGFSLNGNGAGQIRVNQVSSYPTTFTIVNPAPVLSIKELGSLIQQGYQEVEPGQTDVVLESFTAYASAGHNVVFNNATITATDGNLSTFVRYVLWVDSNFDGDVDLALPAEPRQEGNNLCFANINIVVPSGQTVLMEVHADAVDEARYGALRTGIAMDGVKASDDNGTMSRDLAIAEISLEKRWNMLYYLSTEGLG